MKLDTGKFKWNLLAFCAKLGNIDGRFT